MKDRKRGQIPSCVPLSYRMFLKDRKAYRQVLVRIQERRAACQPPDPLLEDGAPTAPWPNGTPGPNRLGAINKCAGWLDEDLGRPDIKGIVHQLNTLKAELTKRGLRYTNMAGSFLARLYSPQTEWTKSWENSWLIRHAGVEKRHDVLDIGGASTIFSFYLMSQGCRVVVIDNDWNNLA